MTLQEAAEKEYPYSGNPNTDILRAKKRDAFIAGANYILENGWVSVEERLPEIPPPYYDDDLEGKVEPLDTRVLVWDGEHVYEQSFGILKFNKYITHWMPLPKPPKVG